jgi:hypothetical protein
MRVLAAALVAALHTSALTAQATTLDYRDFNGRTHELSAWHGARVILLVPGDGVERAVMRSLVEMLDRAYDYYRQTTGGEPRAVGKIEGLLPIAVVPETCGPACSRLGATGIEIQPGIFRTLYQQFKAAGETDQLLFYELARNFWTIGEAFGQGRFGEAMSGGAVGALRILAMHALEVKAAPYWQRGGRDFESVQNEISRLLRTFLADRSLSLSKTLLAGVAPKNALGLSGSDFAAAFFLALRREHGEGFLRPFFERLSGMPKASSDADALDHFFLAATVAAKKDLTELFRGWRWPLTPRSLGWARELLRDDAAGEGLEAIYFPNPSLKYGSRQQIDNRVDFEWATEPPFAGWPREGFSARWTGRVRPILSGDYTIIVRADAGVRLWWEGRLVVDHWKEKPGEHPLRLRLAAGRGYPIRLEYFHGQGAATVRLLWDGPLTARQAIPKRALFPR